MRNPWNTCHQGANATSKNGGPHMDLNVNAFRIVTTLTTEKRDDKRTMAGRAGGKVGGPARARKLTPEQRRAIALTANKARWRKSRP
jgi:hypothetical protein